MASIRHRKRTNGTNVWQVRYRDDNNAERSETVANHKGATELKNLIEQLGHTDALEILATREGNTTGAPKLADWCETYIETRTGVTDGTRARYRLHTRNHLGRLAHLPVDAINPAAIAKWVNNMTRDGLSGKTISNRHGFLSGALKDATRQGHTPNNPCDGTRLPKTERPQMTYLTGPEFAQLLTHIRPDAQDFVLLLPSTGLRFGEASALQARDIDLDAGTLTVSRAWKYREGKGSTRELGPPKTQRSRRTIALPAQVLPMLTARVADLAPTDFIFTNTNGQPWTGSRFHEGVWQPAVRAANNKELNVKPLGKKPRVHDMRHTCASWMLRANIGLNVVQRHLGHESIETTVDVYGHLDPSAWTLAADALNLALGDPLPAIEA